VLQLIGKACNVTQKGKAKVKSNTQFRTIELENNLTLWRVIHLQEIILCNFWLNVKRNKEKRQTEKPQLRSLFRIIDKEWRLLKSEKERVKLWEGQVNVVWSRCSLVVKWKKVNENNKGILGSLPPSRVKLKKYQAKARPGNTNWGGRPSTIDLLIKVACFCKKENNIFNIKMSWSKLVSTRRSTVLSLPLSKTSLHWHKLGAICKQMSDSQDVHS